MANAATNAIDCPPPAELAKFAAGDLSFIALNSIAQHVEQCKTCETALAAMEREAETDPLLSGLRGLHGAVLQDETPLPPGVLAAAGAITRQRRGTLVKALDSLGKFELLEELGTGSFGQVFRARDKELGRIVAIKVLRAGQLATSEESDRFLREARTAAQLTHPGIVALHETGQTPEGMIYLVQEYVEGETLAVHLARSGFDFRFTAELSAEIADALDYAHRNGIIHRDVKPSNIQLDPAGRPHLMDFGLAKREADESFTVDGQMLGTPAYVSPEQARGDARQADRRTDVYSLGVVLYELLTGERPFRGNRQMLLLQVLNDEPRPLRQLNDKVPRDLETICLKAMAKAPARRYATARDLADDLRRYLRGEAIHARPAGRVEQVWRWCRRNPVAVSLLLAVTLGAAFGLTELARLSEYLVRTSALESAAQQTEILDEINRYYSADVVERLKDKKLDITHNYALKPGAIPLPATLTIELARHISERSKSGVAVRLYSDFPFRPRIDGGPKNDFEREALARLRTEPKTPFYRFQPYDGLPALHYATAQVMQETCVQCHNSHPDSTKKDWKVGEVVGVLEIIRPLDKDVARASAGLRGTLVLMATISVGLVGLSILVLMLGKWRRAAAVGRQEDSV